jgi:hypothetical protein
MIGLTRNITVWGGRGSHARRKTTQYRGVDRLQPMRQHAGNQRDRDRVFETTINKCRGGATREHSDMDRPAMDADAVLAERAGVDGTSAMVAAVYSPERLATVATRARQPK